MCTYCSSSGFPFVGVRLVSLSVRCTATYIICFHWSLLLAFTLHYSSSAFLRSLFTQSSYLSCRLPSFLQRSCFFVSDLFGNLLQVFLILMTNVDHVSSPFHPALYYHRLFSLSSCSRILVICVVAVWTELTSPSHYVLAGTTHESGTFPFSFLEIFLSTVTPSTFIHAFAPACILRCTPLARSQIYFHRDTQNSLRA